MAGEATSKGSIVSRRSLLAGCLTSGTFLAAEGEQVVRPAAAPGPLDNPLKGWCTYTDAGTIHQPYSLVFRYVPWRELEPSEGVYAFEAWERKTWEEPKARGKHVVIRVYVDYPSLPPGIPDWLLKKGVKTTPYSDYGGGNSPDYNSPEMTAALERLVRAIGARYDQNPRVAFLQLGLLGFWGEWHTYPRPELFANPITERRIVDAFRRAFPNKKLMARYPTGYIGKQSWLGFHDDMLPEDTDGKEGWEFLPKLREAGRQDSWRTAPFGGEMVPDAAKKWLGEGYARTIAMTEQAHFSWIGPYSPALEQGTPEYVARCAKLVRRMGYEFRLTEVRHLRSVRRGQPFVFSLHGVNQGVAPFYYLWPQYVALMDRGNRVVEVIPLAGDIRRWQPGIFVQQAMVTARAKPGDYSLAFGICDSWTGKPAIGFANRLPRFDGWTVISRISVL